MVLGQLDGLESPTGSAQVGRAGRGLRERMSVRIDRVGVPVSQPRLEVRSELRCDVIDFHAFFFVQMLVDAAHADVQIPAKPPAAQAHPAQS